MYGIDAHKPAERTAFRYDNGIWIKLSRKSKSYIAEFSKLSEEQQRNPGPLYQRLEYKSDRIYEPKLEFVWNLQLPCIGKVRVLNN